MAKTRIVDPEQFLSAIVGEPVELDVPRLGVVMVRGLTIMERKEIRPFQDDNEELTVNVIQRGMVKPKLEPAHINRLYAGDNRVLTVIARKILQLSADDDADELEKKVGVGSSNE